MHTATKNITRTMRTRDQIKDCRVLMMVQTIIFSPDMKRIRRTSLTTRIIRTPLTRVMTELPVSKTLASSISTTEQVTTIRSKIFHELDQKAKPSETPRSTSSMRNRPPNATCMSSKASGGLMVDCVAQNWTSTPTMIELARMAHPRMRSKRGCCIMLVRTVPRSRCLAVLLDRNRFRAVAAAACIAWLLRWLRCLVWASPLPSVVLD
mmetsp:Transcript_24983/g.56657  ORF Transcript_24983/g.56657 Transcript_24983/m.56657 type:complete len:208 (+) Transcript_24983:878-1501(+)